MGSLRSNTQSSWEATAEISRKVLRDSIPKQWEVDVSSLAPDGVVNAVEFLDSSANLTAEELEMTRQDVRGLLERYQSGAWTAEAVATAFLKRSTVANQLASHEPRLCVGNES